MPSNPDDRTVGDVHNVSLYTNDPKKILANGFNEYNASPSFPYKQAKKHTYAQGGEEATRVILDQGSFLRPWIGDEDSIFVWPMGLENFHLEGNAIVGIHKYLGTRDIDTTVQHYDEPHITISGIFEGTTDTMVNNMNALRNQCIRASKNGKILFVPGWQQLRTVVCESYTFDYTPDNRGNGIAYSISMIIVGLGQSTTQQATVKPRPNLGNPKGQTHKTITVTATQRTLRALAKVALKDGDLWKKLYNLNKNEPFMKDWRPGKKLPLHYPENSNKKVLVKYQ